MNGYVKAVLLGFIYAICVSMLRIGITAVSMLKPALGPITMILGLAGCFFSLFIHGLIMGGIFYGLLHREKLSFGHGIVSVLVFLIIRFLVESLITVFLSIIAFNVMPAPVPADLKGMLTLFGVGIVSLIATLIFYLVLWVINSISFYGVGLVLVKKHVEKNKKKKG